jgi:hypothetical protein
MWEEASRCAACQVVGTSAGEAPNINIKNNILKKILLYIYCTMIYPVGI